MAILSFSELNSQTESSLKVLVLWLHSIVIIYRCAKGASSFFIRRTTTHLTLDPPEHKRCQEFLHPTDALVVIVRQVIQVQLAVREHLAQ